MAQSENSLQPEEAKEWDTVGFRDGLLFIVDLVPEMVADNPETETSYLEQCLQTYGRVLSEKLSLNRRDWMGLVFLGTKKWDMEPETKHILTVQKFDEITTGMLKEIMNILRSQMSEYKEMSTEEEYPLHDVLWHAARSFDAVKVAMTRREIILITTRDNPFPEDEAERHRIRHRAKTLSDVNVNLQIIGLGNDWNHELFYKDIEMLANNIESEDLKRTMLEDLEEQLKYDARPSAHLEFRIGNGLNIRTVISSFSRSSKALTKVKLSRETNEILEVFRHLGRTESDGDMSDEEDEDLAAAEAPDNTRRAITCGDEMITFRQKEIKEICSPGPNGIDLLGFKELSLDLRYHVDGPKFVGVETVASDEEKELFAALLYQCEAKNLMAICAVHDRTEPLIAKMIPCIKYGGFYLYRVAFYEQVSNLEDDIDQFIDGGKPDGDEIIDDAGVAFMDKVVKKLRINWDPYMFYDPQMRDEFAYLEALALDTEAEPIDDNTLPPADGMEQKLGNMPAEYAQIFSITEQNPPKRPAEGLKKPKANGDKDVKFDDNMIQGLIDSGQIKKCTIPVLKAIARSLGAQTTGNKAELIKALIESFQAKKAN